jgi:hypothetical protein
MAIKQDVNAPLILTVGVVSGLMLLVVMFGLEAWFGYEETAEMDRKWTVAPVAAQVDEIRAGQLAKIEPGLAAARQSVIKSGGKLPATQKSK